MRPLSSQLLVLLLLLPLLTLASLRPTHNKIALRQVDRSQLVARAQAGQDVVLRRDGGTPVLAARWNHPSPTHCPDPEKDKHGKCCKSKAVDESGKCCKESSTYTPAGDGDTKVCCDGELYDATNSGYKNACCPGGQSVGQLDHGINVCCPLGSAVITDYKTDETLCCSLIRFFQVTDQRRDRTKRGTTALEARDGDVDMPPDDWYDSPRYTCCDLAVNADLWYCLTSENK